MQVAHTHFLQSIGQQCEYHTRARARPHTGNLALCMPLRLRGTSLRAFPNFALGAADNVNFIPRPPTPLGT